MGVEELAKYYQNCDIFVAPSLHETFGLIYLEAMSYGKPVIGTKVGGIPEVIKEGETGLLVPPGNSQALAEAILYLLKNDLLRKKMGENTRMHVRINFSIEETIEETIKNFSNLLDRVKK